MAAAAAENNNGVPLEMETVAMAVAEDAKELEPESPPPSPRTWKKWVLRHSGLVGNFEHLNLSDPFLMKKKNTTWYTEIRAGMVTFLTMAYIIPVNAFLMSIAMGPENTNDLVVATAAVSSIASVLMGVLSNFPFGLAPGMCWRKTLEPGSSRLDIGDAPSAFPALFVCPCVF